MARQAAGAGATLPARRPAPSRGTAALAAASAGAGLVHALVCPEHFKEAWSFGAFFLVAAAAQVAWAWRAWWRGATRSLLLAAAVGNAAVVVLWLVTRTVGLPIGPEPGVAEGVGGADVLATALELYLVVAAAWALTRQGRRPEAAPSQ
jgi:hypothetical protein